MSFLGDGARAGSIIVVTLILAYLTLVLGELAPKRLAMQRAEPWGLFVARPLTVVASLTRPVVWLLSRSSDLVVGALGGDPDREREEVTEEEIRDMVAAQGTLSDQQRTILHGAFDLAERTLHDVLRPRTTVFTLDSETPCAEALDALAASGHSRAPVCQRGSLDDVVGVVHLRDLLGQPVERVAGDAGAAARVLPESSRVLDALRDMQTSHVQLAVVVNEHGGAEGIVTVEDLVEELVGEIYDESDRDLLEIHRDADGSIRLPGRFPAHDLKSLGVKIPEGRYASVAGFVLAQLGHLPEEPGDVVAVEGWTITVEAVEGRAITALRMTPVEPEPLLDDGEG